MIHVFRDASDAQRMADATRMVERGLRSEDVQPGLVDCIIRPDELYSDTAYRLGKLVWYDQATEVYLADETDAPDVLIRNRDLLGDPPDEGVPVHATFAGIHVEGGTAGNTYAVYAFGTNGGDTVRWVVPSSETASGGYYPGSVLKKDGAGGYATDVTCRIKLKCGTGLISGESYQGLLNGTTGGYPVYWIEGNTRTVLDVCVDDVPTPYNFDFRAPFRMAVA